MFKDLGFIYGPAFSRTIVYMLQAVEYRPSVYIKWLWRADSLSKISYRKELVSTRPAKMLLAILRAGILAEIIASVVSLIYGVGSQNYAEISYSVVLLLFAPIIWAHLIIIPLLLGDFVAMRPRYGLKIQQASRTFDRHPGTKIAIAGSYGKTTMKEILLAVLSEGKNVKATPANRNVSISHAQFAEKLHGDEDILIIEYGEGAPGDVSRFAKKTHPSVGVITGLAPAHLDRYKTLENAGRDIFSLAGYLNNKDVYVNGESKEAQGFIKKTYEVFSSHGIADWKVKEVKNSINGLEFTLGNKQVSLKIKSHLLGRHQIGPLSLAAYLGHNFGLTEAQIEEGVAKIEPFEHRMKPYQLSGAWIIDDTYNGNIEGMKAGLALLKELPAKRKIYVTPGLVDQGIDSIRIHRELGKEIAEANPDQVILMKHSVTDAILDGLDSYKGQLIIEDDPLEFYTNLDKFVAAGDLVLMQNDWPDQYN